MAVRLVVRKFYLCERNMLIFSAILCRRALLRQNLTLNLDLYFCANVYASSRKHV